MKKNIDKNNKLIVSLLYIFLASIFLITLLYCIFFREAMNLDLAVHLSIASTLLSLAIIILNKRILTLGIFSVLFFYFTITHFGATTIYILNPEIIYQDYKPHHYDWLKSDTSSYAVLVAIIAQITFIFSASYSATRRKNLTNKNEFTYSSVWLPRIGLLSVLFVLCYFLFNIFVGNFSLFSNYREFNNWRVDDPLFSIAIFLLATGYLLVVSVGSKRQIIRVTYVYIIVSFLLLVTGNKGEVLYAVLSAIGVYYSRFKKVNFKVLIIGLFCFFILIPFISSARSDSILMSLNQIGIDLTKPFLEIGWQLRTVVEVISWREMGENLGWGISYFAPIERVLSSITLGLIPEIPLYGVPWSFGERLPGWGFSQVAESYWNFSILGPIIFYWIIGAFSVRAEENDKNVYKKAWYSSIIVILMILTRNRFSFVPGQIFMALILVLLAFVLDGKLKKYKS